MKDNINPEKYQKQNNNIQNKLSFNLSNNSTTSISSNVTNNVEQHQSVQQLKLKKIVEDVAKGLIASKKEILLIEAAEIDHEFFVNKIKELNISFCNNKTIFEPVKILIKEILTDKISLTSKDLAITSEYLDNYSLFAAILFYIDGGDKRYSDNEYRKIDIRKIFNKIKNWHKHITSEMLSCTFLKGTKYCESTILGTILEESPNGFDFLNQLFTLKPSLLENKNILRILNKVNLHPNMFLLSNWNSEFLINEILLNASILYHQFDNWYIANIENQDITLYEIESKNQMYFSKNKYYLAMQCLIRVLVEKIETKEITLSSMDLFAPIKSYKGLNLFVCLVEMLPELELELFSILKLIPEWQEEFTLNSLSFKSMVFLPESHFEKRTGNKCFRLRFIDNMFMDFIKLTPFIAKSKDFAKPNKDFIDALLHVNSNWYAKNYKQLSYFENPIYNQAYHKNLARDLIWQDTYLQEIIEYSSGDIELLDFVLVLVKNNKEITRRNVFQNAILTSIMLYAYGYHNKPEYNKFLLELFTMDKNLFMDMLQFANKSNAPMLNMFFTFYARWQDANFGGTLCNSDGYDFLLSMLNPKNNKHVAILQKILIEHLAKNLMFFDYMFTKKIENSTCEHEMLSLEKKKEVLNKTFLNVHNKLEGTVFDIKSCEDLKLEQLKFIKYFLKHNPFITVKLADKYIIIDKEQINMEEKNAYKICLNKVNYYIRRNRKCENLGLNVLRFGLHKYLYEKNDSRYSLYEYNFTQAELNFAADVFNIKLKDMAVKIRSIDCMLKNYFNKIEHLMPKNVKKQCELELISFYLSNVRKNSPDDIQNVYLVLKSANKYNEPQIMKNVLAEFLFEVFYSELDFNSYNKALIKHLCKYVGNKKESDENKINYLLGQKIYLDHFANKSLLRNKGFLIQRKMVNCLQDKFFLRCTPRKRVSI